MLQRLIYYSARSPAFDDVAGLVAQCVQRNQARGVTGMLIADQRIFLQVLEGPRREVSGLFQSICRDARHDQIELAHVEDIAAHAYPDWGMGRLDDVGRIAHLWWTFDPKRPFDPWSMRAREVQDFLRLASFELLGRLRTSDQNAAKPFSR